METKCKHGNPRGCWRKDCPAYIGGQKPDGAATPQIILERADALLRPIYDAESPQETHSEWEKEFANTFPGGLQYVDKDFSHEEDLTAEVEAFIARIVSEAEARGYERGLNANK